MSTKAASQALLKTVGLYWFMIQDATKILFTRGVNSRELCRQVVSIGVNSIPIVGLTALFTGMVLALQTAYGLERFGAKNYVGNITGLAFVRELGPVLSAVVLCGRVGAGIAAEIASMVVTEQVDAMRALGANPNEKLVLPRVLAAMIACPLLVILANIIGNYGGLMIAVYELKISAYIYYRSLVYTLVMRDLFDGLVKATAFGFLVVSIACFKGLRAGGGTEGVGRTTTEAVVTGCMVVFISDFFMTKFLLLVGW